MEGDVNLSGKLGHLKKANFKIKYIGPLSRMHKKETPIVYDLMIILSGPEPQRGLLEEKLKKEVLRYKGNVIFIKGIVEKEQKTEQIANITFYNFMNSRQLEHVFNESKIVLCRSGYTTIMDLAKLEKKAFFIPTPGQYEQEYLAKKLSDENNIPFASQEDFKIEDLKVIDLYKGLPHIDNQINWVSLFKVFNKIKKEKTV
jgi:UDP-N-acetylglucosamine transferase subunit ALG13